MSALADAPRLLRQHLIDPEICIRCNTCQEVCPTQAITHDRRNYVVRFDACDGCGRCLPPCPTGAIDSWRDVRAPYPIEDQLLWDSLPPADAQQGPAREVLPVDVAAIRAEATATEAGQARPPWSAAHPYINLYPPARPALATVTGNYRLTADDASSDIRHLVLDFGKTAFPVLEGQSVGIVPPGVDASGAPHHVRLYSVASPRNGERPGYNNLALTVKRIDRDRDGQPVRGVASNYLCDLRKGETVQVAGPYGASFLMPNHPGSSLLMVCTGTGAAPMRAMTERRRRRAARGEGGRLMLFFGARTPSELPYFGPLSRLPADFIDVNLAFSRHSVGGVSQPRQYVQDLIRARAADVAALLRDDDCFIYVCGHKAMEAGVLDAFAAVCAAHGMDFARLRPQLLDKSRLHIETY